MTTKYSSASLREADVDMGRTTYSHTQSCVHGNIHRQSPSY